MSDDVRFTPQRKMTVSTSGKSRSQRREVWDEVGWDVARGTMAEGSDVEVPPVEGRGKQGAS